MIRGAQTFKHEYPRQRFGPLGNLLNRKRVEKQNSFRLQRRGPFSKKNLIPNKQ